MSSSWIRELLTEGRVREAAGLLGHPYVISGEISHGRGVGRCLGFPTGNLAIGPDMLVPRRGVYAARTEIDGEIYMCALNVGVRPTFGLDETVAEFNVLDFKGDLYGRRMELELLEFIRPERAFGSPEEMCISDRCSLWPRPFRRLRSSRCR